jgi:phenylpropionate dioxygenase-like ring-hydroxylating dioxygenase large terminal subunit
MERQEELAVGRRLLGHIEGRTTDMADALFRNRVDAYSCPQHAAAEHDALFRSQPLFIGLSSRLAKPGDYLAEEIAGMPILLVRNRDGGLGAFANVCRHRGAPVAEGCGNARAFSCPYHGWTYDLAGRLVAVTDKVGFAGLDLGAHGLTRLPAGEKHGMMFVRARPVRPGESVEIDVDAHLGSWAEDFAAWKFGSYLLYSVDRVTPRLNWKFAIDTFLESYHIQHLHQRTIAPYFLSNVATFDRSGLHGRACFARKSIETTRDVPEAERDFLPHVIAIYQLFPNSLIIWQLDHVEIWRAFPGKDGANSSEVEMTLYIPEPAVTDSAKRHWDKNRDVAIRTVLEEDFPLGERMQIGFQSGATEEVIYGRNEPSLVHFHSSLKTALNAHTFSPSSSGSLSAHS